MFKHSSACIAQLVRAPRSHREGLWFESRCVHMMILFFTRNFYPRIGGVEKHVYEISRELIKRGNEVTILTETSPGIKARSKNNYHLADRSDTYSINLEQAFKSSQSDTFEAKKIKIIRVNFGKEGWFKKIRVWIKLFGMLNVIRHADVIHCHDVFFWYLPFRFLFPLKKIYTTFHGYETKFPPTLKAKIVRKISEELSNGNICVGAFIKKWYGTKTDFVTYGGVETQNLKLKTQNFSKNRKRLSILLLGRLEEDNGAVIYLEALRILKDHNVPYNLTVLGDGKYKKRFEIYGVVKGFVVDLDKYIDRTDFMFASSYLSIFEGIVRGKIVFSVFQNRLKEDYLRLTPFKNYIYIAGNSDLLVENLLLARNNVNKTHSMAKKAHNWANKKTWGEVVNMYLKLWKV